MYHLGPSPLAFLASIVQSSEDSIIGTDLDGSILSWNHGAERLFGYAAEEAIGRSIVMLFRPEERAVQMRSLLRIKHAERIERFRSIRVCKDGTEVHVSIIISPVKDAEGRLLGVSAIYRDITQILRAEAELQIAKQKAEAASQAKSEFLANMSHEIRTPMNAMLGMTSLLLETRLSPEQEDFAQTIRRAGESLLTVINDILDFSKIEAGKLDIDMSGFALEDVVAEVAELMSERTGHKGIDLNAEIDPAVPRMIHGDAGRIRQVLLNLVGNAVKFTENGEVFVRVSAAGPAAAPLLSFEVRDTGIGIAPEVQERIFESFTQADGSTTRRYGGTGLGLSISRRLVDLMGGQMGVRSVVGEGSTFWFTLPLIAAAEPHRDEEVDLEKLAGLRVLAVDDSENNRRIVRNQLQSLRVPCSLACNVMEAIIQLRQSAALGKPFDVLILDYGMPGMDGIDLARIVRSDPSLMAAQLILLTSYADKKSREAALGAGVDIVLNKPVRVSELCKALLKGRGHAAASATEQKLETAAFTGAKLLLVEDHPDNQKLALHLLGRRGYRCDVVNNGADAVNALAMHEYALVLMDCQMPGMDGFQATAAIRGMEGDIRHTPIVAMTAHAMQGDRERCLAAGMDDYVSKPLDVTQLFAAIERWLERKVRVSVPKDLEELVPNYLSGRQKDLGAIAGALERNDMETIRMIAHNLKGSGAGYGFERITEIGREMEHAAGCEDGAAVLALRERLEDYLDRAEVVFE